ncbi:MAG: glutathione S-transferase family protein [Alphaproteobacteria bacterium]|nr:glutathione S-transferase family protein [Rhizobiaceae bacterium]MBU3960822.1 glutathione S-transferase family protein [Alphaproteobacteria bacterium]MBU4050171.1 glutathione S-transferase family protein [Alphaproteobacteria bacterium]MBU4091439.1 glutathione S-transferase family protein [Alphaproteobacteria bacterium]MBU4158103.1 glutathione S-transferase family protein [Alphaproteobacteria bacterium]
MKLFSSPTSPYSAKVRMAAHHLGIAIDNVVVNTSDNPPELIRSNPLGKIPTLVTDEGQAIFDSRAIMHYLHRSAKRRLYPKKDDKRTEAEVLEALCDGINDCLLAIVYEKRLRPPELVSQDAIDRQWVKVERSLDYLNANMPKFGKSLHGGHFALASLLGYLMLRFPGEWENGRTRLAAWPGKFSERFKAYGEFRPQT